MFCVHGVYVAGEASVAHLRNIVPDEQRPVAEAGPVPDNSPPHRGAAHSSETGRRDPLIQFRDQPGSWCDNSLLHTHTHTSTRTQLQFQSAPRMKYL